MLMNNTVDEHASKLGVPSSPVPLPTLWPLPNTYGLVDTRRTWWTCPSGWRRWAWDARARECHDQRQAL